MKTFFVSIDYQDTKPISYSEIVSMANNPKTPSEYANYLKYVIKKGERITESHGSSISKIEFGIHKTGCIVPFGEGSHHPFSKNFYTEMQLDLSQNKWIVLPKAVNNC